MKKKIIALCLVIALAATAVAGATLAYFTDVTKVNTNTFTVGKVDIKLDETDTDDSTPGEDRDTENTYTNVYPNQTVVKDPMVTFVKNSRDCYVRMLVTVNYDTLVAAFPAGDADFTEFWDGDLFLLEKLVVEADKEDGTVGDCTWDRDVWTVADVSVVAKNDGTEENPEMVNYAIYEFRYYGKYADENGVIVAEKATANTELEPLFEKITFPKNLTNEQIAELDQFQVNVIAHAMQAEGFTTAEAAWAAWDTTGTDNLSTITD